MPPALDQKNELDRTAAMLSALDVLVSAPTAVSWLAAAAGTRTLKLLYDTSWTAFGQDHEPFAPSCRCVMPAMRGDWTDTFAQAAAFYNAALSGARSSFKRGGKIGGDARRAIAVDGRRDPALRISRRRAGIVQQRLDRSPDVLVRDMRPPRPSEMPMPAASKALTPRGHDLRVRQR